MEETLDAARAICDNAPLSIRRAVRSMHFGTQMDQAHTKVLRDADKDRRTKRMPQ
jgi:hypothetical protein